MRFFTLFLMLSFILAGYCTAAQAFAAGFPRLEQGHETSSGMPNCHPDMSSKAPNQESKTGAAHGSFFSKTCCAPLLATIDIFTFDLPASPSLRAELDVIGATPFSRYDIFHPPKFLS